jgi:hypothetical protein
MTVVARRCGVRIVAGAGGPQIELWCSTHTVK